MPCKFRSIQEVQVLLLVAAMCLADSASATAQDSGQQQAVKYCSACHRVSADQGLPPPVALEAGEAAEFRQAPSFRQIAGTAGMDRAVLLSFVQQPHYALPGQAIDSQDINAIVEYVLALRSTPADW